MTVDLPIEVVRAAVKAANSHRGVSLGTLYCNGSMAKAAIRAALQAMCDAGMAQHGFGYPSGFIGAAGKLSAYPVELNAEGGVRVLILRLDPERKPEVAGRIGE